MEILVKMSGKGQLVVPEKIRAEVGFQAGDRFIPMAVEDGVIFRKVNIGDRTNQFLKLMKKMQAHAKKIGLTQKDVNEAIAEVRKKRSSTRM